MNDVLIVVLGGMAVLGAGCGESRDVCDGSCDAVVDVVDVSLGGFHSCAILNGGRLKCWGDNFVGQLGLGDREFRGDEPGEMGGRLPLVDLGITGEVVAVAAGAAHTCALLREGTVKCWGSNRHGQLGLGDTASRGDEPGEMGDRLPVVDLGRGKKAIAIAAGIAHTCALLSEGTVKCWGDNRHGQLGLGDVEERGDEAGEMGDELPEVSLGAGATVLSVVTGGEHTCALLQGGAVKCWGKNDYNQLGFDTFYNRGDQVAEMGGYLPRVNLGTGQVAVALAAGNDHTCAQLREGTLKCWGTNSSGQLGFGGYSGIGSREETMGDILPLVEVRPGEAIVSVVAGAYHTCALLTSGVVQCWGANFYGQVGVGREDERLHFTGAEGDRLPAVNLGENAQGVWVRVGTTHTCAGLQDGTFKCWGANAGGQLGMGDERDRGHLPEDMGEGLPAVKVVSEGR
ncbi:RCC1 domain-containing protein [Chondromyces crocatus]|nr:hypothetical protein [Chondromyces crocatus]